MTFVTAEQYMMYRKAMTFSDVHIAAQIMKTSEPKKQKGLGRQVKNFDAQEWEKHRELVVEEGNWNKFTRSQEDPKMADKLLATGERLLVEVRCHPLASALVDRVEQASPFDKIWGIGFSAAEAKKNKERWGMNLLGQCLMRVRTRLQEQQRDDQQEE